MSWIITTNEVRTRLGEIIATFTYSNDPNPALQRIELKFKDPEMKCFDYETMGSHARNFLAGYVRGINTVYEKKKVK